MRTKCSEGILGSWIRTRPENIYVTCIYCKAIVHRKEYEAAWKQYSPLHAGELERIKQFYEALHLIDMLRQEGGPIDH